MKAIIPAAGLGTRFLPETKAVPKELLPVLNKPVLQYVVEEAHRAPDCSGVVIVNSDTKPMIEEYFKRDTVFEEYLRNQGKEALAEEVEKAGSLPLSFVYQHEPLGLGHAVYCAGSATGTEPFYVLLGDVIVPESNILGKLHDVSVRSNSQNVIAVIKVDDSQVSRFGIIGGKCVGSLEGGMPESDEQPGAVWRVGSMVEKPKLEDAPTRLAIFGRYLLSPLVMEYLQQAKPGVGGEIQLTDALARAMQEEDFYAVVIDPEEGYDTGTVPNLIAANVKMAQKNEHYAQGLADALQ